MLSFQFCLKPCLIFPLLLDVKFDAVSGDYYPIVYFNDYWNLQKDYYPINETLTKLPLRLNYCPLSLWRWQLYAAQNARSPWNFLPEDTYEQSDEDQDSVKVGAACRKLKSSLALVTIALLGGANLYGACRWPTSNTKVVDILVNL